MDELALALGKATEAYALALLRAQRSGEREDKEAQATAWDAMLMAQDALFAAAYAKAEDTLNS